MFRILIYLMVIVNAVIGFLILFGRPRPFGRYTYRNYRSGKRNQR